MNAPAPPGPIDEQESDFHGVDGSKLGLSVPDSMPYDPDPDRERIRGIIALLLVGLLSLMVLLAFAFVFSMPRDAPNLEALKAVLELVFAPIVGLVGAVTGFYYGVKSK